MSASSNDTSSSHNNRMDGEVLGLKFTRCMCNLVIKIERWWGKVVIVSEFHGC